MELSEIKEGKRVTWTFGNITYFGTLLYMVDDISVSVKPEDGKKMSFRIPYAILKEVR